MGAGEELVQRDEVAKALAHLLPVDGNHVVVHPVFYHGFALRCHGLCYLALVVGEDEVHAAAVDVEVAAEVLASHRRALAVPSRETVTPGRGPAHDVLRLRLLPQGEVYLVFLLAHAVELSAGIDDVLQVASRQDAVVVVVVVLFDVEVDRAV